MTIKQIDRLTFAQGGLCFFCKQSLSKDEASIEHLVPSAKGGNSNDENCVICCKAVNALFGCMSLKEKIQVIMNQKGSFQCPSTAGSQKNKLNPKNKLAQQSTPVASNDKFNQVVANLKQRGHSRPRKLKTLTSTISSLFPKNLPEAELNALIQQLQSTGKITITDNHVTYVI